MCVETDPESRVGPLIIARRYSYMYPSQTICAGNGPESRVGSPIIVRGYVGSRRSVQRYWKRTYPAPALRARRRVETPPGAQAQVDWAHFSGVIVGEEAVDLLALHMVLSWSRTEAIVWSRAKDMLSWLACHTACFVRLGGVPATVRVDNEKTVSWLSDSS
jgi:transposase